MFPTRMLLPYLVLAVCTSKSNIVSALFSGNIRDAIIGGGGLSGKIKGVSIFPSTTPPPPEDIITPPLFDNGGEPGEPACMDLMIVVDVTCSLTKEDLQNVKWFAAEVVERLMSIPRSDTQVGVALYGARSTVLFKLGEVTTRSDIVDEILNMDINTRCSDYNTETALRDLAKSHFSPNNGDREDKMNVALLFTGRTVPTDVAITTYREAMLAKVAGVEINIVTISEEVENDKHTNLLDVIPSSPEMVYEVDNVEHIGDITDDLSSRYYCHGAIYKVCAEIVFAFDVSCSINDGNVSSGLNIAKEISIALGNSAKYCGLSYDNNTVDSFPQSESKDVVRKLSELKTRPSNCTKKTRTNRAITFADNNYFDRIEASDNRGKILIIFGDGLESPWSENEMAIAAADRIKQNGGAILWIILTSKRKPHIRIRGIEEQIEVTASENIYKDQLLAFDHNDPNVVKYVTEYVNLYSKRCPVSG